MSIYSDMSAYYNEIDPFAADWLRNLIRAGCIADGEVDTRSIADVRPDDIRGFAQYHFFAGIGGWSYALRLAGWPDDRPVWTGSCPCQPFSVAGRGKGTADERHLWPELHRLIAECRPSIVFGEQVASRAGREWLSGVFADLESVGYAGAGADLCAAGVGAPHIRQRLYWVAADMGNAPRFNERRDRSRNAREDGEGEAGGSGVRDSDMADTSSQQKHEEQQGPAGNEGERRSVGSGRCGLDNRQGDMADADDARRKGRAVHTERPDELAPWSRGVEWRRGADGKERRVKSGVRLLVDGLPNRVGLLRGFGNAIVPQIAAEVIKAFMDRNHKGNPAAL